MNKDLLTKLQQNNLIQGNMIILDGTQAVDTDTFATFFGDSSTYDTLVGTHNFTWNGTPLTKTGTDLGYKPFFDKWKELGIIS